MCAFVFAVASAAEAHAVAPAGGPLDLLLRFDVEWPYVIWQFISFAVLAAVFYQFGIKPILSTMDERNARLAEGLKNAEATAGELEKAKQDSAAIVKQARLEGARLVEETRQAAKTFLEQQQAEASARANDLIARARQAVELEHKNMLEQSRLEVARLVVATTRQVLARELSESERARYNEAATREIARD